MKKIAMGLFLIQFVVGASVFVASMAIQSIIMLPALIFMAFAGSIFCRIVE